MDHRDLSLPRLCVPLIIKDKEDVFGKIVLGFIASYTGYYLIKTTSTSWKNSTKSSALTTTAKSKRKERDNKGHNVLNEILPTKDMKDTTKGLTSPFLSAYEISKLMNAKRIKISDYLLFCIHRTRQVGKEKLNAVTEELYDEAYQKALQLDKQWTLSKGPLAGLPISIKDCIAQENCDATCGAAARCFRPYSEDAVSVKLLKDAGLVPFVRSNVPQLLLLPESDNQIWGCTNNPWDTSRTPGGSSGGEAALVASGCTPLGLGSDIGGSIRLPAHFTGIVGFKPTPGRLSFKGMVNPRLKDRQGQIVISSTAGPMTRSVQDCIDMMSILASSKAVDLDPTMPCLRPFDSKLTINGKSNKGRIAYMRTDGYFQPCATIMRAIDEAKAALELKGYELVPFEHPQGTNAKNSFEVYCSLMAADGNWYSFIKGLEGEKLHETYRKLWLYTNVPNFIRPTLAAWLSINGELRMAGMVKNLKSGGMNVRDYWELIGEKKVITDAYNKYMEENNLDAILMPPVALPAPPHGMIGDLLPIICYCTLINLLHWPSGVVPVTTVRKEESHYNKQDLPSQQRDRYASLAEKAMEGSTGLPVGVQIVTRAWKDEQCLGIMKDLEDVIQFNRVEKGNIPNL